MTFVYREHLGVRDHPENLFQNLVIGVSVEDSFENEAIIVFSGRVE